MPLKRRNPAHADRYVLEVHTEWHICFCLNLAWFCTQSRRRPSSTSNLRVSSTCSGIHTERCFATFVIKAAGTVGREKIGSSRIDFTPNKSRSAQEGNVQMQSFTTKKTYIYAYISFLHHLTNVPLSYGDKICSTINCKLKTKLTLHFFSN